MTDAPSRRLSLIPCPHCGKRFELVRPDWRPDDSRKHVLVYEHPDGTRCEAPATKPAPDEE